MFRIIGLSVAVVLLICLAPSAVAGKEATLELRPACNDHGISGVTTRDGVTVIFEACEKAGRLTGKLEFEDGSPLASIEISGTKMKFFIGGVDTSKVGSLPKEEQERLEVLFTCPEATLAAGLHKRLTNIGFAPQSGTMKALAALLMIFNQ